MGPKLLYLATPLAFNAPPPTAEFSWDDLREILPGCQRMAKVPNGVETLPKILTGRYRRQTDGRETTVNVTLRSLKTPGTIQITTTIPEGMD